MMNCAFRSVGPVSFSRNKLKETENRCIIYFYIECIADLVADKCGEEMKDVALEFLKGDIKEELDELDVSQCNKEELEKNLESLLYDLAGDRKKRFIFERRKKRFLFGRKKRFLFERKRRFILPTRK
uniref:Clone 1148 transcribed RNA sequence n=1 Tax=Plectreurys tristis TaxID=33319 RepID=A0A0C4W4D9_PLETR|nr:hypothetical protein [Plectreurys tristis]